MPGWKSDAEGESIRSRGPSMPRETVAEGREGWEKGKRAVEKNRASKRERVINFPPDRKTKPPRDPLNLGDKTPGFQVEAEGPGEGVASETHR